MRVVGLVFLTFFGLILLVAPLALLAAISYQDTAVPATEMWQEEGIWKTAPVEEILVSQPAFGINPTLGAVFVLLLCWGILAYLSIKAVAHTRSGQTSGLSQEETRMIQEIYRGLSSMEQRIESLETILIERYKDRPVAFQ